MDFADIYLDRRQFSTDTNEYANGSFDDEGWSEALMEPDYDYSFDSE